MGKKVTTKEFIINANLIHNNRYDYTNVIYIDAKSNVKIICSIHGEFEQTPNKHLAKKGCSKCGFISRCNKAMSNTKEFITKASMVHGDKFNYDSVEYNGRGNNVKIICKKHGEFNQTPHNHLAGNGCPICMESKGESQIADYLDKHNINYERQKRFNNCRNILPLPFDFYILDKNICIEYQGIQHFKPRTKFGGHKEFNKVTERDLIKVKYCNDNNLTLIKIKYNEVVKEVLDNLL